MMALEVNGKTWASLQCRPSYAQLFPVRGAVHGSTRLPISFEKFGDLLLELQLD